MIKQIRSYLNKEYIYSNEVLDIYKTLNYFTHYFKDKDFIKDDKLYKKVSILNNLYVYIENIHEIVNNKKMNYSNLLIKDMEHNSTLYIKDLISNKKKLIYNHNYVFISMIEDTKALLEYYINDDKIKSINLYKYIIHIVNVYREIYTIYLNKE